MNIAVRHAIHGEINDVERTYTLDSKEKLEIDSIITELAGRFSTVESEETALACEIAATRLPAGLLSLLKVVASGYARSGYVLIRGFELDDEAIGDSPQHWDQPWHERPYLREELFQVLLSSAIGGVFGWRTQENGRFLRHIVPIESVKIVPIESVKNEQLGGSSATTLMWHTEEAFHVGRADFFTLMCYRNREQATTNIACVDDLDLPEATVEILRQPRFTILPDKSHTPVENTSEQWKLNSEAFSTIREMMDNPQPVPLIYGRSDIPMMRVDQAFVSIVDGDEEAAAALTELHDALDRAAIPLQMEPGDIVLLDNLRVAHGRSIYKPDYGPKHRWMRRVNIDNGRRINFGLRDCKKIRVML